MFVAALVLSMELRARILTSIRGAGDVAFYARCDELMRAMRDRWVGAVLVEPWDAEGTPVALTVRELRRAFPSVPVAVYCALDERSVRELVELTRAGADELLLRGVDDVGLVLRDLLLTASVHRAAAQAFDHLAPDLSTGIRPFFSYCLQHAANPPRVHMVAAALGVDRRTLVNRLTLLGLPGPAALISWSRLILASRLLEDPGRTVEQVAHVLNFGSGAALRNMFRRYTRLRPAEIRRNGGMRFILDLLGRRLQQTPTMLVGASRQGNPSGLWMANDSSAPVSGEAPPSPAPWSTGARSA